jgi:hypothetical protein
MKTLGTHYYDGTVELDRMEFIDTDGSVHTVTGEIVSEIGAHRVIVTEDKVYTLPRNSVISARPIILGCRHVLPGAYCQQHGMETA